MHIVQAFTSFNIFLYNHSLFIIDSKIRKHVKIGFILMQPELGTLEWNFLNSDRIINL